MASVMISRMDFLLFDVALISYSALKTVPISTWIIQQGRNLHLEVGKWLQQRQNHFEGVLTLLLLNKNLLEDEANTQKTRTKKWRLRVFLTLSLKCLAFVSGMPGTQWVLGCIFREVTFSDQHMRTPRSWFLKYGTEHNLFNPLLPFIQSLNIFCFFIWEETEYFRYKMKKENSLPTRNLQQKKERYINITL